jgi:hypothetical protein
MSLKDTGLVDPMYVAMPAGELTSCKQLAGALCPSTCSATPLGQIPYRGLQQGRGILGRVEHRCVTRPAEPFPLCGVKVTLVGRARCDPGASKRTAEGVHHADSPARATAHHLACILAIATSAFAFGTLMRH